MIRIDTQFRKRLPIRSDGCRSIWWNFLVMEKAIEVASGVKGIKGVKDEMNSDASTSTIQSITKVGNI